MARNPFIVKMSIAAILMGVLILSSFGARALWVQGAALAIEKPLFKIVAGLRATFSSSASGSGPAEERTQALAFTVGELQKENRDLQNALHFKEESGLVLLGARVLLYTKDAGREALIVDQGSTQGVAVGDEVIDEYHIFLGTISEAGNGFAKVEIASNPGTTFEARIAPFDLPILAQGIGARAFLLKLIPRDVPVRAGDPIALSSDTRFRAFLLGSLADTQSNNAQAFQEAYAVSLAHPENARNIFIITTPPHTP